MTLTIIDNLELFKKHNDNTSYILKIKRNSITTFKVNIIVEKKIYPKHYKGSYTLFSTKKGSCYFLIELFLDNNINIYTNFKRTSTHTTTFVSDRKKPNLNFLINKCWHIIYNIQDRIPARIKNKYWKRIISLWKQQYNAINDRLVNHHNSKKAKHTKTFFKFSYAQNIFYFGWRFGYNSCNRTVPFVESNNIKFCPYHTKKTHIARTDTDNTSVPHGSDRIGTLAIRSGLDSDSIR